MAVFTIVAALIGGAISIGSRIANQMRASSAANEAIAAGAKRLREGQALSAQNAQSLAQDNMAILSLSGVSASGGTAAELHKQTMLQKDTTINKMQSDFNMWKDQVRREVKAGAATTAFSVAGDVLNTGANVAYGIQKSKFQNIPNVAMPKTTSPGPGNSTSNYFSSGATKGDLNG